MSSPHANAQKLVQQMEASVEKDPHAIMDAIDVLREALPRLTARAVEAWTSEHGESPVELGS